MKLLLLVALACATAYVPKHVFGNRLPSAIVETKNGEYDPEGHKFYQGDMILDQAQLDFLESPIDTRKAHSDLQYRWPNGRVPYRLSEASEMDRDLILRGLRHWEMNSCVRFNEVAPDYVGPHLIFQQYGGCWSNVGRHYYQPQGQDIAIGTDCVWSGTVVHEVGHALGFHHEQSRSDRDDYLVILDHNIDPAKTHNFDLEKPENNYSIPYDLTSVMHYPRNTFALNGKNSMVTRDPFKHFVIGQRDHLSFIDKKLANIMYNCSASCDDRISCENEGYVDENCRCVCPSGFSGPTCRQGSPIDEFPLQCGGAIDRPTTISTPNFPGNYPSNSKCVWVVTAPVGSRVSAHFTAFHMLERNEEDNYCTWDFMELRTDNMHEGEWHCGRELMGRTMVSQSNKMILLFFSDSDYYEGFEAQIDFV